MGQTLDESAIQVETQLIREGFDLTTVTTWLGNSPDVARKHYLQVTPGDIAKATEVGKKFSNSFQNTGESTSVEKRKPAFSSTKEHEKAGQYTREDSDAFISPLFLQALFNFNKSAGDAAGRTGEPGSPVRSMEFSLRKTPNDGRRYRKGVCLDNYSK